MVPRPMVCSWPITTRPAWTRRTKAVFQRADSNGQRTGRQLYAHERRDAKKLATHDVVLLPHPHGLRTLSAQVCQLTPIWMHLRVAEYFAQCSGILTIELKHSTTFSELYSEHITLVPVLSA